MPQLPWEIVEKIMKFSGAYHFEQNKRPYITTLHLLGYIIAEHGIKKAIIHHREIDVLERAYADYNEGWPIPVIRPKHSPFHQNY